MSDDVLINIAAIVLIVALVILIVVLVRAYQVLGNIKITSEITKKRAIEFDDWLNQIEKATENLSDVVTGFVTSLDQIKNIKNKIGAFLEDKKTSPVENHPQTKAEDRKEQDG